LALRGDSRKKRGVKRNQSTREQGVGASFPGRLANQKSQKNRGLLKTGGALFSGFGKKGERLKPPGPEPPEYEIRVHFTVKELRDVLSQRSV